MRTRTRRSQQIRHRRARRLFRNHPRIVSLFSGYGVLDPGVQSVIGGEVIAQVEFEEAPSCILDHHWPGVSNRGDVTDVDWAAFIRHTLKTGTSSTATGRAPSSPAGSRAMTALYAVCAEDSKTAGGPDSGPSSPRVIDKLRPELVVIENVRGRLLSTAADRQMESDP